MGLPAFAADYLFLGPLMVQRLVLEVPDVPVELVETSADVLREDQRKRVLKVMWGGDRVAQGEGGRAGAGAHQVLAQRWIVFVGLGDVGKQANGRATKAGPAMSQVHQALAGWTPPGAARAFRRVEGVLAPTFTVKNAVYPLGFEIQLNL